MTEPNLTQAGPGELTPIERLRCIAIGLRMWGNAPMPALHPDNYVRFADDLDAALAEIKALRHAYPVFTHDHQI